MAGAPFLLVVVGESSQLYGLYRKQSPSVKCSEFPCVDDDMIARLLQCTLARVNVVNKSILLV